MAFAVSLKYVFDHGIAAKPKLEHRKRCRYSQAGCASENGKASLITVDMGEPILDARAIPTLLDCSWPSASLSFPLRSQVARFPLPAYPWANPHCVNFVEHGTVDWVLQLGPQIEVDPRFPRKNQCRVCRSVSRGEVQKQTTWERGSGETWACGTGASAVCVAGVLSGRTDRTILNH